MFSFARLCVLTDVRLVLFVMMCWFVGLFWVGVWVWGLLTFGFDCGSLFDFGLVLITNGLVLVLLEALGLWVVL